MLSIEFDIDGYNVPMYIMGRYFGYSHFLNQLHPYSTALYYNKKQGKSEGVCDDTFIEIYEASISIVKQKFNVDCICSVPVKPCKPPRFDNILKHISKDCSLKNIEDKFICTKDYPDQKSMSAEERQQNIIGVFKYTGDLTGKTVVLIDDIVTTGSTLRECVKVLKSAGACEVIIIVLAVNQLGISYWNNNNPQVICPICHSKMILVLWKNMIFNYWCPNCSKNGNKINLPFSEGRKQLCDSENSKFDLLIESENI